MQSKIGIGIFKLSAMAALLFAAPAHAELSTQAWDHSGRASEKHATRSRLPTTQEEIDSAIARIERRLGEVRLRTAKARDRSPGVAIGAFADELTEREQLLRQLETALDQSARYLRSLKELRRLSEARLVEHEAWNGFADQPTLVTGEQLIDAVSAQRLELRTAQMMLSIFENEIARHTTRLSDDRKKLRLATDQAGQEGSQDARHQWLLELADLRNQSDEAAVESAETGRLLTWEAIDDQQRQLAFLERKLAAARAEVRITKGDLENVLKEIAQRRTTLQEELEQAIAADQAFRTARDQARGRLREAQITGAGPFSEATPVRDLQSLAEAAQARVDTSGQKVEMLRGCLQLADYIQAVWQDRFWATQPHTLSQLRAKQRQYDQHLKRLREWKTMMEKALSAVSDQILRQSLRAADGRLTAGERELAKQLHATLEERAAVHLRAVGALALTEDFTARLNSEVAEQVKRISMSGWLHSVLDVVGTLARRIWDTELYIAEDSVIAGGQKVSMPRSITLGKVIIALAIFLAGLAAARWAYRVIGRLVVRWTAMEPTAADARAKAVAALIAVVALMVAMASVRIPWTVFAFLGGALAIGVGFGAQTLINNFISGVILLCERSIRVGDIVEVDDQKGKVVRMGFRNSLLGRGDGIEVLVPNSQFLEKKVVNWTLSNDLVRYAVSVSVAYGEAPDAVSALMAQAAAGHRHVIKDPAPEVLFEDFGPSAQIFTLKFWMRISRNVDGGMVRSELRHRINALFDEAGIALASPQRAIHLDSVRPLEIKVVNSSPRRITERDKEEHDANEIDGLHAISK